MKTIRLPLLVLLLASFSFLSAQDALPAIKLTGIVVWDNQSHALLELSEKERGPFPYRCILRAGERDGACEVQTIDAAAGSVAIRDHAYSRYETLKLQQEPEAKGIQRTFHFQAADSSQVLDIYQMVAKATILAPQFPRVKIELQSGAGLSPEQALEQLDAALAAQGLVAKRSAGKFIFLVPESQVSLLSQIPKQENQDPPGELLPPGLLKFQNAELLQFLELYQALCGRTILRPDFIPPSPITLRTQTTLTHQEAIWVMEAMLFLHGIKTTRVADKFVFTVPLSETNALPKFDPEAIKAKAGKDFKADQKMTLKLQMASPLAILGLYGEALGRKPVPGDYDSGALFSVRSQTELNAVEAIFALEAVAVLNHARFDMVGEDQFKLIQFAPPPGGVRKPLPIPRLRPQPGMIPAQPGQQVPIRIPPPQRKIDTL